MPGKDPPMADAGQPDPVLADQAEDLQSALRRTGCARLRGAIPQARVARFARIAVGAADVEAGFLCQLHVRAKANCGKHDIGFYPRTIIQRGNIAALAVSIIDCLDLAAQLPFDASSTQGSLHRLTHGRGNKLRQRLA